MAQIDYEPPSNDPRFKGPSETRRRTTEPVAPIVLQSPVMPPYARCAMRGMVTGERDSSYFDPVDETRARLLTYEFGFERAGDPSRMQAYFKVKIVRPADGTALRIMRPLLMHDVGLYGFASNGWPTIELDADGFGGARINLADLDELEIYRFSIVGVLGFRIAVTLPEMGFDRVYSVGDLTIDESGPAYMKCVCAMESALLREAIEGRCRELE